MLFGVGRYTVTVELPRAGGLYPSGNVTYRGTEVGRVESTCELTDTGVEAVLSLQSGIDIPSDLRRRGAQPDRDRRAVRRVAAPRRHLAAAEGRRRDPAGRHLACRPTSTLLLDATNRGLQAIPQDNLKTVIDESLHRLRRAGPRTVPARQGLHRPGDRRAQEPRLADHADRPIQAGAGLPDRHLGFDPGLGGAPGHRHQPAADPRPGVAGAARQRRPGAGGGTPARSTGCNRPCRSCWPTWSASARSRSPTKPASNSCWCCFRRASPKLQATVVANLNTKQDYKGAYLSFNLNLNLPPPCTTGFLPAQQRRAPSFEDYPDRAGRRPVLPDPAGLDVQRARRQEHPCLTVPGKRAPTVKMCESDEQYVPLNDGYNWKGDPNATLSGQDIPQLPPGSPPPDAAPPAPAPPPIAVAEYDPATGTYVGPDGKVYTQSDLAQTRQRRRHGRTMLIPPGS